MFSQEFSPKKTWSKISHGNKSTSSQTSTYFLFIFLGEKNLTVTDLVQIFKSETLSRKIPISKRLGSGMQLRNRNEPKRKKIKTFPHNMNAIVLVFFMEYTIPTQFFSACKIQIEIFNCQISPDSTSFSTIF